MHGKRLFFYASIANKFFAVCLSLCPALYVCVCVLCIGIFCVGFLIFRLIALLQSTVLTAELENIVGEFGTLIESQQCMQTVSSQQVANSHQTECVRGKYLLGVLWLRTFNKFRICWKSIKNVF